jgi:hypothetical protein
MDWLQFIATLVGHLAWPIVVIVLFVILRRHLGSMADRLIELSFGGAKITLDKKLQEGAEILERVAPVEHVHVKKLPKGDEAPADKQETPKPENPPQAVRDAARRLRWRDSAPAQGKVLWESTAIGQIISSYERVDEILFGIADILGFDPAMASSVVTSLLHHNVIDKETAELYKTLREARNLVAHGRALPDRLEALEYVRQASYLEDMFGIVKTKIASGEIKM